MAEPPSRREQALAEQQRRAALLRDKTPEILPKNVGQKVQQRPPLAPKRQSAKDAVPRKSSARKSTGKKKQ
jgi:hypothetical protein